MGIVGIDGITYGVTDLALCKRYFLDWGLHLVAEGDGAVELACMNGCRLGLVDADSPSLAPAIESGPTVREVIWGVKSAEDLAAIEASLSRFSPVSRTQDGLSATDPNGMKVSFRLSVKTPLDLQPTLYNTSGKPQRIDTPSPAYDVANPIEISHVVFYTENLQAVEDWYVKGLGFQVSDRYPGRGLFMRCSAFAGHHDIFFLQLPQMKRGLNHVAFSVRDIHEVFGGGLHFSRHGWQTEIGPGRHPISSGYFWYFKCPAGGATEYSADEDFCTADWLPREFLPLPENYAEWAAMGEVDMRTRKKNAVARDADSERVTVKTP